MTADMSCILPGFTAGLSDDTTSSNNSDSDVPLTEDMTRSGSQSQTPEVTGLMDRFEAQLTDIDRQAADLDARIVETRDEVKYITSLLLKYEEIRTDLNNKLQGLENQRRSCLLKKNELLATHDVFGSSISLMPDPQSLLLTPGSSDLPVDSNLVSKSILLPKLSGSKDKVLMEPSSRNIQDMVSELFSNTNLNNESPPSTSLVTGFNNSLNLTKLSQSDVSITPTSSMDGLTEVFTPFGFDNRSPGRLSTTPIGHMPPLSFSEAVSVPADQPLQQKHFPSSKSVRIDAQSPVSGSVSPLSNFGLSSKELDDDLDSFLGISVSSSPAGSRVRKTTATTSSTSSNNNSSCNNNSNSSNETTNPNNGTTSRFIMRQTNGTHVAVGQNRAVTYNSVLSLETSSNGYVYKALADRSVSRFRFGNLKDCRSYAGHGEKVKVLCLDHNLQQLYTGCDDGKVRCFNISSGSLLSEFQCEGSVIGLERGWDNCLMVATNKGWIYMCKNHFSTIVSTHRTFNWICTFKPLLTASDRELRNKRCLLILPMKHRPTIIDASDGKILKEISVCPVIESKPCLQVNGGISIIATVTDKNETARSLISVFDASQDWGCIQKIQKEGIVAALRIHGTDLYVGLKFPSFGHIECYKWSNKVLSLKWIACVAYVSCIAVLPSDVVLNGGPDGTVYNTTPNLKGPFLCANLKCRCKQPFARRKDLEFHYSKVGTITSTSTTSSATSSSHASTNSST